jgi:parallel beta-helix repeat protein
VVGIVKNVRLATVLIIAVVVTLAGVTLVATRYLTHLTPSWELWSESHISIDGNGDFVLSDAYLSGTGTVSDPYQLSAARIDFSYGVGIEISNTSAHFLLKDSAIAFHDVSRDCIIVSGVGIRIFNATNFSISNISMSGCEARMGDCSKFHLSENNVLYHRVVFENCSEGLLTDNVLGDIMISDSTGFILRSNAVSSIEIDSCMQTEACENFMKTGGIVARDSEQCSVVSNTAGWISFEQGTIDSRISHNFIRSGTSGVFGAVHLDNVENITVDGNTIENCSWGGGIQLMDAVVNCTIVRNNISNCYGGIALRDASGCLVYHNNIFSSFWSGGWMLSDPLDCEYHAGGVLDEQGWLNFWDNGYPDGGNYYFDYNGLDVYSGQLQDTEGGDEIGDTPLVIFTYLPGTPAEDHYPLMTPYIG